MKLFVAFTALVAVAVASPLHKPYYTNEQPELQAIIAAIQSPSTDPATAALLEQQLAEIMDSYHPIAVGPAIVESHPISVGPAMVESHPISVGPAMVESHPISVGPAILESHPISVGPAIIDFPLPEGAVEPSPVVQPSPVVIGEVPSGSSPLVQIIVNVNQQESGVVAPAPVDTPVIDEVYVPGPVNVVDHVVAPEPVVIAPIIVGEPALPGPVNVVDNVDVPAIEPVVVVEPSLPGPVNVVDNIVVEPVIVGTPIIPAPAFVLPEQLN